jgi:hypothetical protein
MLEYGSGVNEGAGRVSSGAGRGQSVDVGENVGQMITDSIDTLSAMPPAVLLAGLVVIVLGLMFLKRAF